MPWSRAMLQLRSARMPPSHHALMVALSARIEPLGFDVLGGVNVGAYNATLDSELHDFRLPELDDARSLVIVVGNTRRLWPHFLQAYASTALGNESHPLDAYSRLHIGAAVTALAHELGLRHALRYSFDPRPNAVAIQRLVTLAGVAEVSPVGLCVHPEHGPWLSLRAAAVFSLPGPAPSAAASSCSTCSMRPCMPARERVLELCKDTGFTRESFEANWEAWLAMRDACPVGKQQRYSEQQIRYHYKKQLSILRE